MEAKDLAERLKFECRQVELCAVTMYRHDAQASLGQLIHDNLDTILEALETVAGIEKLLKNKDREFVMRKTPTPGAVVFSSSWRTESGELQVFNGRFDNPHSAVIAAVEACEKGV